MSFKMIKLKDLMPLREAEEEKDAAGGGDEGGENPFAAADDAGGEDAAAEAEPPADDTEEGGEEETDAAGKAETPQFPIKFNLAKVKKYNNAEFISSQGELKSIDKKGLVVTVQPDNVDIFVNFSDIL
jgi:hypothetical protein